MAVDSQPVSINFGQGIDKKTDPKLVLPGKCILLKDAVFTNAKRLTKRNGYDVISASIIGGGSITNPQLIKSYANQTKLVCGDGASLFEYSPTVNAWRNVGKHESLAVSNTFVSGANQNEKNSTCASITNYALVVYDCFTDITLRTSGNTVKFSVFDLAQNEFLANDTNVPSGAGNVWCSRAIALAGTQLAVCYFNDTNGLCLRLVTPSSSGVALGSEIVLASDIQAYKETNVNGYQVGASYDIVQTSGGAVIVYSSNAANNPIKLITINTTGVTQNTATLTLPGNGGATLPLTACVGSDGKVWVYWQQTNSANASPSGVSNGMWYSIYSSTLVQSLAPVDFATDTWIRHIAVIATSTTSQSVYYSKSAALSAVNGFTIATPQIFSGAVHSDGSTTGQTIYLENLDLLGKPFTVNAKNYLPCVYSSPDQMSGFLIDLTDGHVAGKFLRLSSEGVFANEVTAALPGLGFWWRDPGHLTTPQVVSSTMVIFAAGKVLSDTFTLTISPNSISQFLMGTVLVSFDYSNADANQAIEANGVVVLNGSVPRIYDGGSVTELGFHSYPELIPVSNGAGTLPAGTYGYQAVYVWYDQQGFQYQSAVSDLVNVALDGAHGAQITVKTASFSQKNGSAFGIQVAIYRTDANGTIPFLIGYVANSSSAATIVFNDTSITSNKSQPIYTNGGAVLDNSSPASSMLMWLNNNRLNFVDSEAPKTDIWYTKTFASGIGIQPSNLLINTIDSRLGNIAAGIAMDEKTAILKQQGLMYFVGDGANDSGLGSTLTPAQIVPSDTGCTGSKGVILTPAGIIFRTPKGIYRLTRGIQAEYFGFPVEGYNSQDIQSSTMIQNSTRVQFLTSSGLSLAYDYFFDQWSTFTNHQGLSGDIWNGSFVYVRTDGSIFKENASTFLDNGTAYAPYLQSAWIKAGSIQGLQRVRELLLLGDFTGAAGHGVQVSVAYDFGTTLTALGAFSFSGASGPYQFRGFFPQQKCDAFQLVIQEVTTGASGESVDFSDLALEVGIKKGLRKIAATSTVG